MQNLVSVITMMTGEVLAGTAAHAQVDESSERSAIQPKVIAEVVQVLRGPRRILSHPQWHGGPIDSGARPALMHRSPRHVREHAKRHVVRLYLELSSALH